MYDPITFNEKVHNHAPSLSQLSRKCVKQLMSGPHPDEYLHRGSYERESAHDVHSDNLYQVLTLTTKPIRRLLKEGSPPDGFNNL